MLAPGDEEVRGALTRQIARLGHAPSEAELAEACGRSIGEVSEALERLHAAHALLLHPRSRRPWVVHPFALALASCWVATAARGYWASCLYCALGIAAATRADAEIATRLGGEGQEARYRVRGGELVEGDGVFHLSTPVARWWDDVIFACSSFQPFRDEAEVDAWCARHALPRGAVMSLPALWRFARDWYGGYLEVPWKKRTADEAAALFARHGLTGAFWAVTP
jgi:Alkylmercury lyase